MAYKGGRNVAAFADRPGEESGKENFWFLVDCVNYRKVVRMGIVFARIAGIVRRLAVLVTPGACCACAERNRSDGQARREIEMTEASGAWKIRSTSFRARLSDVYQTLLSVDRSSATAETLLPVLDMLLAAVRGIDFLKRTRRNPVSCIWRPSCCSIETTRTCLGLCTTQRVCSSRASGYVAARKTENVLQLR